jgi:hypothetical protein
MNDEQASQQPKVVAAMEDKEKERKKTDLTKQRDSFQDNFNFCRFNIAALNIQMAICE